MRVLPPWVRVLVGACVPVFLPAALAEASSGRPEAAVEVEAALVRLHAAPYRQRDIMVGPFAAMGAAVAPMVTEHVGDRTRLVSEMNVPSLGSIRTERVTVGSRAAVRTTAPGLVAKLEQTKQKLTVSSARSLLQQIVSAAAALQTGGLSTASWLMEATRAAATIKTTAEARAALDRTLAGLRSWQLASEEEDQDVPAPPAGIASAEEGQSMRVEKQLSADGATISYRRTPLGTPLGEGFYSVLIVDAHSGLPKAEENYLNGQRMMRSEFFDVGSAFTIDLPDCLR